MSAALFHPRGRRAHTALGVLRRGDLGARSGGCRREETRVGVSSRRGAQVCRGDGGGRAAIPGGGSGEGRRAVALQGSKALRHGQRDGLGPAVLRRNMNRLVLDFYRATKRPAQRGWHAKETKTSCTWTRSRDRGRLQVRLCLLCTCRR